MRSDLIKALSISTVGAVLVAGVMLAPAVAQDTLPPGPGMEQTLKACGGCHGIGQILTEKRSHEEWSDTVTQMITNGAPVADADFATVVNYLSTHFGTSPPPAAGAAPAAAAPEAAPAAPASGATQPAAGGTAPADPALAPPTPAPAQ